MQSFNSQNLQTITKLIEHNKISPTILQENMKKQLQRSRAVYAYPANVGTAKLHRAAIKFGYKKSLKDQIPVVCPCCQIRIDNQNIPICYSTTSGSIEVTQNYEQFKLPSGVAVYFSFLKAALFLCFIFSAILGYVIYGQSSCQIKDIIPDLQLQICKQTANDLAKLQTLDLNIIKYLFLGGLGISIIFLAIYRCQKNAWHRFINTKNMGQDSYSVLISNIPILDFPKKSEVKGKNTEFFYRKHLEAYLQQKIKRWVQHSDQWPTDKNSNENDFLQLIKSNEGELKSRDIVKSISLCYNLSRLEIIDDSISKLIEEHKNEEEENTQLIEQLRQSMSQDRFSTIPQRIEFINDCRLVLNKQFAQDDSFLFNLTHFVGHAFVSFQYQHYKNFFLDAYQKNSKEFIYNGNVLNFAQAAHPSDISWKNLRLTNQQKNRLHLNSYFIILLVLTLEFIVVYVLHSLLYNRNSLIDAKFTQQPKIFVYSATLLIVATQFLMRRMVAWLVSNQKHKTKVNECITYINLSVIAQSAAAIVPLFLTNFFLSRPQILHFYAHSFILWSSSVQILVWFVNPEWMIRQLLKWWRYRNNNFEDQIQKFQIELNKQFQLPEYDIKSRYSFYLQKIYVCAFFSYQAPVGVVLTFVALSLMFWIDKINLFRRSSLYYATNIAISNHSLRILQLSLFVFGFSFFYFSSDQLKNLNWHQIIALLTLFVYVMFVVGKPQKLQRAIFGREAASNEFKYDDCVAEGKFNRTYWSQNPSTTLIEEKSITKKQTVTNPALMREYGIAKNYESLL